MGRPLVRDLTGERYGYLTVVGRAPNRGDKVMWHCVCDCGQERDIQTFGLIFGDHVSCGHVRSEMMSERNRRSKRV
ncbi:MAG: hypothetical protein IJV90_01340 [Candidatus Methanomethylophilaceae archaeon]|nr:hypothetical protein [Candidatus Methanomethylophilaceae archaeon]